jgi:sugar lactone lactonase YvrE
MPPRARLRSCKPWAVEVAVRANARLAEGPRWDAANRRLLWVDIEGCELHLLENGEDRAIGVGARVSAAAPTTGRAVLLALADRLALVDPDDESVRTLVRFPHGPALRANDGACDAAGRFWIGTMGLDVAPSAGALYRYDGTLRRVLDGVTLSNGIGWPRDDSLMYYIDSAACRVDVFDFELASGRLDERRPFVSIDEEDGIPDGLTVDDEGGVWVALYGGRRVRRYDARGRLDSVLEIPAENVTSCCFGGDDGRSLFVTTAAPDGNVYVTEPGVSGPPAHVFQTGGTRTAPSDADDTSAR